MFFEMNTNDNSNYNHREHSLDNAIPATQNVVDFRAGANYFRLVRPLHALKCEQSRGVWGHAPPGKNFKIRHSEIASEAMFGPKKLLESPHP